jgi:hypothetical protein
MNLEGGRWLGDPDLIAIGSERELPQTTLDHFGFSVRNP